MEDVDEYESLPNSSVATNMVAGAIAGITEHALMFPFDAIKVGLFSFLHLLESINPCLDSNAVGYFSTVGRLLWSPECHLTDCLERGLGGSLAWSQFGSCWCRSSPCPLICSLRVLPGQVPSSRRGGTSDPCRWFVPSFDSFLLGRRLSFL
jgi:hypothetical protein